MIFIKKIQKILDAPDKEYTKEEAIEVLKSCGILNENSELNKIFIQ